jgi:hypothetical protein
MSGGLAVSGYFKAKPLEENKPASFTGDSLSEL